MKLILETKPNTDPEEVARGGVKRVTIRIEGLGGSPRSIDEPCESDTHALETLHEVLSDLVMPPHVRAVIEKKMEELRRKIESGEIKPGDSGTIDMTGPDILPGDEWKHEKED